MEKKDLPKGISDFKKLIEKNCYYVDKSLFIEDIIKNCKDVTLITRPRRFGKTLNMSMLKYFFDIREKENNRKLFNGLKIEETKYMEEFGKYPVIYLTMKGVLGETFQKFEENFRKKISSIFEEYSFLQEKLSERNFNKFNKYLNEVENYSFTDAFTFLGYLLSKEYNIKPIFLIDEYDAPLIYAKEMGYLDKARGLIREFYQETLKEGSYSFAVVTGILKIVKESIFSGINNLEVSSVLDKKYNHFGMSEKEVEAVLKYFNLEITIDDTRAWYNGYIFGGSTVYNPWSILNHCEEGALVPFWVNTSANVLIKESLSKSSSTMYKSLFKLANDGEIVAYIDTDMVLGDHYGEAGLFSLMLFAGYLTVKEKISENEYLIKIPNFEVKSFFSKTFLSLADSEGGGQVYKLESAIKKGIVTGENSIEETLANLFENYVSSHDTSKYEIFYHNIILGIMIGFERDYYVSSNLESGHGRYDLAMISKKNNMPSYLFEFKVAKSMSVMDKLGIDALAQIREKNYKLKFDKCDNLNEIAVIFSKKKLRVYVK